MKITWTNWKNPTQFKHLACGQAFVVDKETLKLYMKIKAASEDELRQILPPDVAKNLYEKLHS